MAIPLWLRLKIRFFWFFESGTDCLRQFRFGFGLYVGKAKGPAEINPKTSSNKTKATIGFANRGP